MSKTFGLIGYPLTHSFSKKYFKEKFERENISDCHYDLFPIEHIEQLPALIQSQADLVGLNVTIPYKELVIPYLDELDEDAAKVGAVNTIHIQNGQLKGYNTDVFGFEQSLVNFLPQGLPPASLILGTGGAAKAVAYVLQKLGFPYRFVSRKQGEGRFTYHDLENKILDQYHLIINTTPLGTYPNIDHCPALPYEQLGQQHFLFDLVYNPAETLFLKKGKEQGASTINGLDMLIGQAERAWAIWE